MRDDAKDPGEEYENARFYLRRSMWISHVSKRADLNIWFRMVGIVIADYTSAERPVAFPGIETISRNVGCSRHTTMRAVAKLEAEGLLIVTRRKRAGNEYRLRHPEHFNVAAERLLNVAG